MTNFIYIKYGELTLKGKNKKSFINALYNNIKLALSTDFGFVHILKEYDHTKIVNIDNKDLDKIICLLKQIPGIATVIESYSFSTNSDLEEFLLKKIENKPTTFKVETKRVDKSYVLDSLGYSRNLGGFILQNFSEWTVDVKNPKTKIFIEIKKDEFILNWRKHKAAGGFPVGINGRALMLLSGGLDSPVASRLLLKKGMKVDFLTFITPPHTSDKVIDKVKMLINKITIDSKLEKSRLYICNFTNIQHELAHISKTSYQITLMRRYFFRIAQSLAISQNYDAIATGESLGQVASQTINSINTISSVLSEKIVLRPLLCLDKSEIIKISKEIDTYDTSIIPFNDSCGLFVPQNPVTNPNKEIAEKLESELEFIDGVVEATIKNKIVINDV